MHLILLLQVINDNTQSKITERTYKTPAQLYKIKTLVLLNWSIIIPSRLLLSRPKVYTIKAGRQRFALSLIAARSSCNLTLCRQVLEAILFIAIVCNNNKDSLNGRISNGQDERATQIFSSCTTFTYASPRKSRTNPGRCG